MMIDMDENQYIPEFRKILKVTRETKDTSTFRIDFPGGHDPGQFVEVSVLNIGEAPISVCSHSDRHIDLCIRNVGNVTNAIHKLRAGDKIGVRGPFGHGYPMADMRGKNIVFVAGGTGVAAVKSAIDYTFHNSADFGDVHLIFGFRSYEDMLFRKDMDAWKKKFGVGVTLDESHPEWKGPVGVVTRLLADIAPAPENTVAIVCGPPIMIKFVLKMLQDKFGFTDDQIYVSLERLMYCGMGKCGHCQVGPKYVCKDGPVFLYKEAKWLKDQ